MFNKAAGIFFLSASLGFLALSLGFFTPVILLFSPLIALSISLKPSRLPAPLLRILVFILMPVFFAAILAPFRALTVLALQAFSSLEQFSTLFSSGLFAALLPSWFPSGIDLAQGIVGVLFGFSCAAYDGYWRYRLTQEIAGVPTSKIRSVAVGLAELRGVARREQTDPGSGPLLEFSNSIEKKPPFYLEDETGKILIDPQGAKIRRRDVFNFGGRLSEIVLTKRGEDPSMLGTPRSGRLLEGDSLYAFGYVEKNAIPDPAAPYVLRCKPITFFESDIRNLFFVTDADDARARGEILRGLKSVVITGVIWVILSTLLAYSAVRP